MQSHACCRPARVLAPWLSIVLVVCVLFDGRVAPARAQSNSDPKQAWQFLAERFPELREARLGDPTDHLLRKLLRWAGKSRKITAYDRACRAINLVRKGDELVGGIHWDITVYKQDKTVRAELISFGATITVSGGYYWEYTRGDDGRWKLLGSSGYGRAEQVGLLISRVSEDAIWYNALSGQLVLRCTQERLQTMSCAHGGTRECTSCLRWSLPLKMVTYTAFMPRQDKVRSDGTPVDCSVPCAPMTVPRELRDAVASARSVAFWVESWEEPHPFLFRTLEACQSYRATHKRGSYNLDAW